MLAETQSRLRFGPFEIDEAAGELRRNGQAVPLAPQPFRLLLLLASTADRLVTREEIQRQLWPEGVYVDFEQSLHFAIRQVREALGDAAGEPQYVKTVPRRGYRFIARVERTRGAAGAPRRTGTDVKLQKALWANIAELRIAEARRRRITALAVVGVALALILWLALR